MSLFYKLTEKKTVYVFATLLVMHSCSQPTPATHQEKPVIPVAVQTKGLELTADSILPPVIVTAGKPIPTSLQPTTSVATIQNTLTNVEPLIVEAGKPLVTVPGTDTFAKPIILKLEDSLAPYIPSQPVISLAPRFKDEASHNVQYYDVDQNLPNAYVHTLYYDRAGNLWIGMAGSLARFDGKSFTVFTGKEGLVTKGANKGMYHDKNGHLWFGTSIGVCRFDGKKFRYYKNNKDGWPGKQVNNIIEDKQGNIWFGSERGLIKYDGKIFTGYDRRQGLPDDQIASLVSDKWGSIWIGTRYGVCSFDGNEFQTYTTEEGLIGNSIFSLDDDPDGNIWIATQQGVCKFTGSQIHQYTSSTGLLNNDNRKLLCDRMGNVWVCSYDGGVNQISGKTIRHITTNEGLTINTVWALTEDGAGNIWIGTDGAGVCRYAANSFTHFNARQGMGYTVMSVMEDSDKNMWVGAYAKGLWKYNGNSFTKYNEPADANSTVRTMLQDKEGNIWFGREGGGVIVYNGNTAVKYGVEQGLSNLWVNCLKSDSAGNVWIGTNAGLNYYDGNTFKQYTTKQGLCHNSILDVDIDKNNNIWVATRAGVNKISGERIFRFTSAEGLGSDNIKNIWIDQSDEVWIGTIGGGLYNYNGTILTHYTTANGLSDNNIRSIIGDNAADLPRGVTGFWLSTDNGINHVLIRNQSLSDTSMREVKIQVYKRKDGLKGEDFCSNSVGSDSRGGIWWGSVKSLTVLSDAGSKSENEIPPVRLDYIKLEQTYIHFRALLDSIKHNKDWFADENKTVNLSHIQFSDVAPFYNYPLDLELPYDINNIEFNFSAIDWNAPHKLQYQFILEGAEKDWHPVTTETKAIYTNLGSGSYVFKVRARGFSGVWSQPVEYAFVVHPPWWKTVWAYVGYIISALIIIFILFKWRTRSLLQRQRELEKTVEQRTVDVVNEKNRVEEKNRIIEEKQEEILDSINYARQIQYSLLANNELLQKNLPQHFVLFIPKDIVSGDFYWATSRNGFYLGVCDSTGHGVPGAFMSLLNISFLNEAINEKGMQAPNEVLNHVRQRLILSMEGQDGMDATLVRFEKNKITYAAAHNRPVLVRNNQCIELPADKMPVGKSDRTQPFALHQPEVNTGEMLYFFTDGYADQFGGPKGKKFKYAQLNKLLVEIHQLKMPEQQQRLKDEFFKWKGEREQIDDVCVIGIRI